MSRFSLPRTVPVQEYWSSDRGLTALLVSLMLLTFVFLPLEASDVLGANWFFLVDIWFCGVVLAGAASVGWRRVQRGILLFGVAVLLTMLAFRLVSRGSPSPWSEGLSSGTSAMVLAVLTALILARVFEAGPVTRHRIFGAVAVYLLLGLVWAELYRLVDVIIPHSLQGVGWKPRETNLSNFVYFSLTTLTTAGFGDILPVSLPARSLASLEGMVGMLFPAVLIARLVSMSLLNPSKD